MSFDFMERIRWRQDLTMAEKAVALHIAWHADDEDGASWPAVETLALGASCSVRTVQNSIKSLVGKGLLRRVERRNRSTIYVLVEANLPMIERPRRMKEKSPMADVLGTGAGGAGDLFATGANDTVTGANGTVTGAGAAPRIDNRIDNEDTDSGNLALPAVFQKALSNDEVVDMVTSRWNELAELHPGIQACRLPLDNARRAKILTRSKSVAKGQSVEQLWGLFFARIDNSNFLQGRVAPTGGRTKPFTLSLNWALTASHFNDILENRYGKSDNERTTTAPDGRAMGPTEQAAHLALKARRAARERRE